MDSRRAKSSGRAGNPDARGDRGAHGRDPDTSREGGAQGIEKENPMVKRMQAKNAAKHAPRYAPGENVRVAARRAIGHCRTPWYLRGKSGVIASVHGIF